MNVRRFRIDLAEARDPRRNSLAAAAEHVVEFNLALEGQHATVLQLPATISETEKRVKVEIPDDAIELAR